MNFSILRAMLEKSLDHFEEHGKKTKNQLNLYALFQEARKLFGICVILNRVISNCTRQV